MSARPGADKPGTEGEWREALARDIAATARLLGAHAVRASIVQLATMKPGRSWNFAGHNDGGPDSAFSTTPTSFTQLAEAAPEETMVRRLSPRRWAFAWRLDDRRAVFGEVHFNERRYTLDSGATALLRLVCDTGFYDVDRAESPPSGLPELAWPSVDRRSKPLPRAADFALLACAVAALVLSAWLWLGVLPRGQQMLLSQHERLEQLDRRGDATLANRLAVALATGDYGEVQQELSELQSLGYFASALVTNKKRIVVAMAGPAAGIPMGAVLEQEAERGRRVLKLALGSQDQGALWLATVAPSPVGAGNVSAVIGAALTCLASLATVGLWVWRYQHARRHPGA